MRTIDCAVVAIAAVCGLPASFLLRIAVGIGLWTPQPSVGVCVSLSLVVTSESSWAVPLATRRADWGSSPSLCGFAWLYVQVPSEPDWPPISWRKPPAFSPFSSAAAGAESVWLLVANASPGDQFAALVEVRLASETRQS